MIGKCPVCPARQEEIVFLREQVKLLQGQLVRLERAREGLPELAPEPRKPLPPMPAELRAMIDQFDSSEIRVDLQKRALRSYRQHGTWEVATQMLTEALEVG